MLVLGGKIGNMIFTCYSEHFNAILSMSIRVVDVFDLPVGT